jgi:hypothetical protein
MVKLKPFVLILFVNLVSIILALRYNDDNVRISFSSISEQRLLASSQIFFFLSM